jgi:hypothetical protein
MSGSPDQDLIAQTKLLDVSGVKIELVTKGKGAPLLFLHGMDGIEGAAAMIGALSESIGTPGHVHHG